MKQLLKYTLLTFLAALIFYGGAGVNLVSYCCSNCFNAGLQAVIASETCCTTHEQESATAGKTDYKTFIDKSHHCGITRVEFEWTTSEDDGSLLIIPFVTDVLYDLSYTSLLTESEASEPLFIDEADPPTVLPPRDYLSLLTTLLI